MLESGLRKSAPATNMLIIATPHNGIVSPECASSREALLDYIKNQRMSMPIYLRNCNIARARNDIFIEALRYGADVLFIDSDMEFTKWDYNMLLNSGKDVVTAVCYKRKPPYTPCVFNFSDERRQVAIKAIPDIIFSADACGMAFCLIKFNIIRLMTSSHVIEMLGKPFNQMQDNHRDQLEEDMSFCMRLKTMNIPIWAIPKTMVLHDGIGYREYANYAKGNL
jgi:hypothetical protein